MPRHWRMWWNIPMYHFVEFAGQMDRLKTFWDCHANVKELWSVIYEITNARNQKPNSISNLQGNVHSTCLQEWERVRKTRRCEICKDVYIKQRFGIQVSFTVTLIRFLIRNMSAVLRSFFQYRYAGIFFCKITNIAATALIAYANIMLGEVIVTDQSRTLLLISRSLITDQHCLYKFNDESVPKSKWCFLSRDATFSE